MCHLLKTRKRGVFVYYFKPSEGGFKGALMFPWDVEFGEHMAFAWGRPQLGELWPDYASQPGKEMESHPWSKKPFLGHQIWLQGWKLAWHLCGMDYLETRAPEEKLKVANKRCGIICPESLSGRPLKWILKCVASRDWRRVTVPCAAGSTLGHVSTHHIGHHLHQVLFPYRPLLLHLILEASETYTGESRREKSAEWGSKNNAHLPT